MLRVKFQPNYVNFCQAAVYNNDAQFTTRGPAQMKDHASPPDPTADGRAPVCFPDLIAVVPPVVDSLPNHDIMEPDHVVDLTPAMFADPVGETDYVMRDSTTARRRTHPVVLTTTHPQRFNTFNPLIATLKPQSNGPS